MTPIAGAGDGAGVGACAGAVATCWGGVGCGVRAIGAGGCGRFGVGRGVGADARGGPGFGVGAPFAGLVGAAPTGASLKTLRDRKILRQCRIHRRGRLLSAADDEHRRDQQAGYAAGVVHDGSDW
jgi:hypothetical protein